MAKFWRVQQQLVFVMTGMVLSSGEDSDSIGSESSGSGASDEGSGSSDEASSLSSVYSSLDDSSGRQRRRNRRWDARDYDYDRIPYRRRR